MQKIILASWRFKNSSTKSTQRAARTEEKDGSLRCSNCFKTFSNNSNLQRHKTNVHKCVPQSRSQFACRHCDHIFENYITLFHHVVENHSISQTGGRIVTAPRVLNKIADTIENEHNDHEMERKQKLDQMTSKKKSSRKIRSLEIKVP